ncbi:PEPxxWA-CTERM sorting domain-containing protein [Sphingomonas sp. TDK1]|uniref:PEPxxWA-CTERM sorting domain-containing protein n=1 Tax=Sphingomonas sp. TDK1 TaxID=453247 RepID=UPI0007D95D1D|nr:PEPxxWA-CTERM sorting domain-containing protein [Sphingomonas sp. TDK1]OAN66140.1 hypothetical protein A7X12_12090 [Sphingomonas sp. TDK1]
MRTALMAAALAFGAMAPAAADAAVVITGVDSNPGILMADMMVYTPGNFLGAWPGMGRFLLSGTEGGKAVSFLSYCIDPFKPVGEGAYERAGIGSVLGDPTRQQQMLTLLTHSDLLLAAETDLSGKQTISAATQLAVWEILTESGKYDTTAGDFYTYGGNSNDARSLANSYLTQVTSGGWAPIAGQQLQVLYSPTQQSQVFLTAVPEPASWAMMIGGFAFVGGMLRRRRSMAYRVA